MRLLKIFSMSVIILSLLILISCKHSPEPINEKICFETEVLPIFQTNCGMAGCHDGKKNIIKVEEEDEDEKESQESLRDYQSIMRWITPKDPLNSKIYKAITATSDDAMPPDGRTPLSLEQRNIIKNWILQGADSTACE
ncbi:MAG: hypothetical protein HW421_2966 [Ignavibacteria bacterium]|nr:hypothetical protein [Ignavibacteria bacterium]